MSAGRLDPRMEGPYSARFPSVQPERNPVERSPTGRPNLAVGAVFQPSRFTCTTPDH